MIPRALRWALPVLAILLAGLGFYHVRVQSQPLPPREPPAPPPGNPFPGAVAAVGTVEARTENIAVGSALAGVVLEVYFPADRAGQRVTAGTPLFRVDDRHLKAQLALARTQLAVAQARLAKMRQAPRKEELPPAQARVEAVEAQVALLRDKAERGQRLAARNALSDEERIERTRSLEVAQKDLARARAELDLLRAGAWQPDLDIARAEVAEAEARVAQLTTEIERATVRAPVDGEVLQVNVRPGEAVSGLPGTPLVILGDRATLHVRVEVNEEDLPVFRPDAPALAFRRGDTAQPLPLRLVRVEPLVKAKKAFTGDNTEPVDTRVLQVIYAVESSVTPVHVGQVVDVFIRADPS